HHAQPVGNCRADNDRRAMLIVVEYRDLHPLPTFALDVEAFGSFDVLEVDAAERGLKRADDIHQFVGIALVELDVKAIDTGKLLEQDRLSLHDRFSGERSDRSQTEDR